MPESFRKKRILVDQQMLPGYQKSNQIETLLTVIQYHDMAMEKLDIAVKQKERGDQLIDLKYQVHINIRCFSFYLTK